MMMLRMFFYICTFALLCPAWSATLFGDSLGDYRRADRYEAYARDVLARREAFFKALQVSPLGPEWRGPLQIEDLPVVRPHRPHFSRFFKDRVEPASRELMRRDQQDAPSVFDPSKFLSEIEEEAFVKDQAVVLSAIGSIDVFASELLGFESRQKALAGKASQRAGSQASEPGTHPAELAATVRISNFLRVKLPKNDSPNAITLNLVRVEIYDRIVSRLVFETTLDGKAQRVSMTLEMLASFRTGRDAYYVNTLAIVYKSLSRRLEDFYKKDERGLVEFDAESGAPILRSLNKDERSRKALLEAAAELVKAKAEGALVAHDVMSRLSPAQVDFLIGFFVDLRGDDLPVVQDLKNFEKNFLPQLNIEQATVYPQLLVDFQFYQQLYRDLDSIERAVAVLRGKQKFEREVIEEIEGLKR